MITDSDPLDYFFNMVCIYLVLTVLALSCVYLHCVYCIVLLYLHFYNVTYILCPYGPNAIHFSLFRYSDPILPIIIIIILPV